MIGFLIFGILVITGVMWLLIRRSRNRFAESIKFTRSPRDLGAIMLGERFGQPVPIKKGRVVNRTVHTSNNVGSSVDESRISRHNVLATIEAVTQGSWFGMGVVQNLVHIDEHVYTAMGTLAGEQLDTIGDLSQYLSTWESAELGQALPEAAVAKLMGHLAEPVVAQNLEDLGIQVEMPDLSNQEGYDLVLNGEYFANVKTVADASSLVNHFDKYPKIPVIVPEDMAGIPRDSIAFGVDEPIDKLVSALELKNENIVLVDNQLSHAEMFEFSEVVSDGLLGSAEIGIPLITLALSGFREIRLIAEKKTNLISAAKNLGLDLVGTGGGGAVGASTCAFLLEFALPGSSIVICAIIGGIGGAALGRSSTDKLKRHRLNKAMKKYNKQLKKADKKIRSIQKGVQDRHRSSVRNIRNDLTRSAKLLKSELDKERTDLIRNRRNIYRIKFTDAQRLLNTTLTVIENERQHILTVPGWKRLLMGRELNDSLREQVVYLDQLAQCFESKAEKIIESRQVLVGDRALQFLQLLLCVDEEGADVRDMVRSFEVKRKEFEVRWQESIVEKQGQLIKKRFDCMKGLAENVHSLQKGLNEEIGAIRENLESLSRSCEEEMSRLGVT